MGTTFMRVFTSTLSVLDQTALKRVERGFSVHLAKEGGAPCVPKLVAAKTMVSRLSESLVILC
jgi:phosphoribosylcarboxyaminoimidazole (NCAIR) mutase